MKHWGADDRVLARCDCGTEKDIALGRLQRGASRSLELLSMLARSAGDLPIGTRFGRWTTIDVPPLLGSWQASGRVSLRLRE